MVGRALLLKLVMDRVIELLRAIASIKNRVATACIKQLSVVMT